MHRDHWQVSTKLVWPEMKVQVSGDYLGRIVDNITSNVTKYADKAYPVVLTVGQIDHYLSLRFANQTRQDVDKVSGTHVGVENIRIMMEKMGGQCQVEKTAMH